ncbi:hypothetical protein J3Q64DRAFT_1831195 [Phycomyces blakesleeanus]|uniref:SLC41A/MgtE integral membrane domain-containing protein n=2 Tax=Phycomyces blakesleeanus TaxID=4837 RepID=A0A167R314_PHYB8|nr:hypothetical protein PHYBLDRAFT_178729 [Phycomyces blakesleeanus NRRL 1555(-)]OAD80727.1 hypothetical protein PHYBLDRAFT_178729 [Phycomyces blakesleeanus NRRL 1555(-)]|eukprot:XP_018298767.1 hypothetical protein PHYBLDRAFT_178729 [Phycomyces blakesleeanus NRRL 1555(-)]
MKDNNEYIELSKTGSDDEQDEPPDICHKSCCHGDEHLTQLNHGQLMSLTNDGSSTSTLLENAFPRDYDTPENERKKTKKEIAKDLACQALPSLIISVVGFIIAGVWMDQFQHWDVFLKTSELFILVPILLNLKGNLEMNLAARLSTSANLGDLDPGPTRWPLLFGNLALLQVQALVAGAIAGIASFGLGLITKPGSSTSYYESMYMTSSSMISASFSGTILGVFMCALILMCRKFDIDPDNIACPLVSSLGDIVTLVLLSGCAVLLERHMNTLLNTFIFFLMLSFLPVFGYLVWRNKHVKDLLFTGWSPIIFAMLISSLAGILLEKYVEEYKGVALLTPVLIGLAGNLGSIYASRISTCLHSDTIESYRVVEWTLLGMNMPVQTVFLLIIWAFSMGQLHYNAWFFFSYFCISMCCTWTCLKIGKFMTLAFWKMGYDPDNYVIPYLTASIDVIGTVLLVLTFSWLTSSGANDMKTIPTEP